MPDFYQISQGGQHQSGAPVPPPSHPVPQVGRQPPASMGMGFQQRPVDPRSTYQIPQQQPFRPVSQQAARPHHHQQQQPQSDFGSPLSQQPYPTSQSLNGVAHPRDNIIPDEFGRFIEVSDLTAATFTEEKYYQYLSTPIAIRFEKIEPQAKYDSAGERVESTWLNCTRSLLPNFHSVQADEEIQRLNKADSKKGLTLVKKNQSLGSNAQIQVKKAERDLLAAVQDRRFHIVLKQLDWTERSIVEHHGKGTKRHSSKKPRKERGPITAYFSRCPKPDQVPSALYRQLEIEKFQAQTQADQQRRQREITAHEVLESRAREKRYHEEKMAEHKIQQEEAIANRIHEQGMMSQQQQQRPTNQQMPPRHPMHPGHQGPHPQGQPLMAQPGPGLQIYPQGRPPIAPQQSGALPPGYAPGRHPMAQQPRPVPQQYPPFQPNNAQHQGRPQQPPNGQGMPPPGFRQMPPQQGQQAPPRGFSQMPPHPQQDPFVRGPNGEFVRQPTNGNRPIVTVLTEHDKHHKHKRGRSGHYTRSSDSSSDSHSVFDSDSERSSASTKRSSLASGSLDSPHMTRALPTKPKKPNGGAGSRYIVDSDDDFVRDKYPPVSRRHRVSRGNAYIQTGSERKVKVTGLSPQGSGADPLAQMREAYLVGLVDRERLPSEVDRLEASARRYQPPRRLSRSDTFSEADRLNTLPMKYRSRRLSRSDAESGRQPKVFQEEGLSGIRRVTTSEVDHGLDRERARDFGVDISSRARTGGTGRDLRYDGRDLEHDFAARLRIGGERLDDGSSHYDVRDPNMFRERQRQRESIARDEHEDILRRIREDGKRQYAASPDRDPYFDVAIGRDDGRFEGRAGFGSRGRP